MRNVPKPNAALKSYNLSLVLRDPRKVIACLRYYDAHLVPGKYVACKRLSPIRKKTEGKNWVKRRARILESRDWNNALRAARRLLGLLYRQKRDGKGKIIDTWLLTRDVWRLVQSKLGFEQWLVPHQGTELLFSPRIEVAFHSLPVTFRMTKQLKALSEELGPMFLERVKAYLARDYDKSLAPPRPRIERRIIEKQPPKTEVTVKQFARNVLNKIRL